MTLTLTLAWWHIPTAVTLLGVLYTFFWPADGGGYFGGITRLFMAVPALIVAMATWVIAGFFK